MKTTITVILIYLSLPTFGQFNKFLTLNANGSFDFKTKGLGTNDAGVGLTLDGTIFANHKLQLLLEASTDGFIGDKLLIVDAQGRSPKSAVIYSMRVGPQFFILKNIAISTTYGPFWHRIRAYEFTNDYGFKFGITTFFGKNRRFTSRVFIVTIPKDIVDIQYFGLGIGYRFY
jgi:hypothetical protein